MAQNFADFGAISSALSVLKMLLKDAKSPVYKPFLA
jgi:hypothetical protein|nr:MAG TPA: hypothetical protein [Caudoviricetes sp.]